MTIDKVGVNQYINTHLFIPRLCNGSTSDSGSDCGGSNPPCVMVALQILVLTVGVRILLGELN